MSNTDSFNVLNIPSKSWFNNKMLVKISLCSRHGEISAAPGAAEMDEAGEG